VTAALTGTSDRGHVKSLELSLYHHIKRSRDHITQPRRCK